MQADRKTQGYAVTGEDAAAMQTKQKNRIGRERELLEELAEKENAGSAKQEAADPEEKEAAVYGNRYGDSYMDPVEEKVESSAGNQQMICNLKKNRSLSYLLKNFYILNPTTTIDEEIFDVEKLLSADCTMKKCEEPQILILHTHGASEYFSDSRKGNDKDSVIGVGDELTRILEEEYGYQVLHDRTPYDLIDGKIDRNQAYTVVDQRIPKLLEQNPQIEVVIDLHRDASSDGKTKRVTTIDGKKVAKVMFFNGLSRNLDGDIAYLYNPNLQGNLAFSLQMKLKAMEYYDDFTLPIFLKGYRYSLHMKEKSLLIELGNEVNTVGEAKNAMEPLAKVLDAVLTGK